jgi:hypothetical protein
MRLSLADALSSRLLNHPEIQKTGKRLLGHFLNDNTSPETSSFHIVQLRPEDMNGRAAAKELAKRYLFTQLLVLYANQRFRLKELGQQVLIFHSPHPPVRQKQLNACISDSFYRELFMSPCLGWDSGEAKRDYMVLCHQVLSRSHLNAAAKLREAGIITNNLIVLPSTSNISLANNGFHVSLGSRKLTDLLQGSSPAFGAAHEKYVGDLVIKIVEHFLPLFVGSYSAAPYRLDFKGFHPETVLGFLPHELDYTHLRMIWRRWKKKASNRVFHRSFTPFGPEWLDETLTTLFRLRGDYIPDFRLLDYPVSLMSTKRSPALNGSLGSSERLRKDLDDLGVFDSRMSLYLLYKLRKYAAAGFCGFEGRYCSQFESFEMDMAKAIDLQVLITALAFKYVASGACTHQHIPDTPFVESERRQIFFGAAIGLPTFYVAAKTPNLFLKKILTGTRKTRPSRRYPGYLRIYRDEYLTALHRVLQEDAADLIEILDMAETMQDAQSRAAYPLSNSVETRLTRQILREIGASNPLSVRATEFNLAAEGYYQGNLKRKQLQEGLAFLTEDLNGIASFQEERQNRCRNVLNTSFFGQDPAVFLQEVSGALCKGEATLQEILGVLLLLLVGEMKDSEYYAKPLEVSVERAS